MQKFKQFLLRFGWLLILVTWIASMILLIILCYKSESKTVNNYETIKLRSGASDRYLNKIKFETHTYIILSNGWSTSGDFILHDPDCVCLKKEKK